MRPAESVPHRHPQRIRTIDHLNAVFTLAATPLLGEPSHHVRPSATRRPREEVPGSLNESLGQGPRKPTPSPPATSRTVVNPRRSARQPAGRGQCDITELRRFQIPQCERKPIGMTVGIEEARDHDAASAVEHAQADGPGVAVGTDPTTTPSRMTIGPSTRSADSPSNTPMLTTAREPVLTNPRVGCVGRTARSTAVPGPVDREVVRVDHDTVSGGSRRPR